jgi:hypothetical protein
MVVRRGGVPGERDGLVAARPALAEAAGVAELLVDEWVSPQVGAWVAADLDGTAADMRTVVVVGRGTTFAAGPTPGRP